MSEYRLARFRGKWAIIYYRDGRRHRRSTGKADRVDAERIAQQIWANLHKPAGVQKVRDLWDAYCREKAGKTVIETMTHTAKALSPLMGLTPDLLTIDHSRDHAARRRDDGISDGTIWTELGHLRTVLNWSEQRGLIARAPYIERPAKPAPRDRHLTANEAQRLISAADMPHIKLYIVLALTTAARNRALLDLKWNRVDFSRGRITLTDPDATQAQKRRAVVPMNATARKALTEAQTGATGDHVIEWGGRPVKSVKRGFAKAVERAGLDDVSPHVLRHTAAVWMAEAGVPMSEISQYLGHSNTKITERVYARFGPDYLGRAAGALEME